MLSGFLSGMAPDWVPRLALQCMAAPLGGITTSFITNPLDAIRARIQVGFLILKIFCFTFFFFYFLLAFRNMAHLHAMIGSMNNLSNI